MQEVALATTGIVDRCDLLDAEALGERADQLVDRRALLSARSEIEAAQGCVDVIARRLKDVVEEVKQRLLQSRHLGREAEQRHSRIWRRLVLQPIELLFAQSFE